jgi:putative FmdB family regulatory protein
MPLYEYQCDACGHRFEVIRKFSDAPLETCEKCGGMVTKLPSSPAIQFKGSGWYITDYARAGKPEGGKPEAGKSDTGKSEAGKSESAASTSDAKSESKGESKSGTSDSKSEAKTESKPPGSSKAPPASSS